MQRFKNKDNFYTYFSNCCLTFYTKFMASKCNAWHPIFQFFLNYISTTFLPCLSMLKALYFSFVLLGCIKNTLETNTFTLFPSGNLNLQGYFVHFRYSVLTPFDTFTCISNGFCFFSSKVRIICVFTSFFYVNLEWSNITFLNNELAFVSDLYTRMVSKKYLL